MSGAFRIRRLVTADAASLMALRQAALRNDPLSFGSSPTDDRLRTQESVERILSDQDQQAVFGGFDETELIGMIGSRSEAGTKERHKGFLWGMYVAPQARGNGIGRALLESAISFARDWPEVQQLHLSVTDAAMIAKSLYETAGFRVWGREPRALAWQGRFVDEFHLVLELHNSSNQGVTDLA